MSPIAANLQRFRMIACLLSALAAAAVLRGSDTRIPVQSQSWRSHTNWSAGYAVSYPTNWFLLRKYRNAYELQNHDEFHPVRRMDEASLILTEEQIVSAAQAERRVKDLIAAASTGNDFHLESTVVEGHAFFQWTVLQKASVPVHPKEKAGVASSTLRRVSSVLVGKQLIRFEGTTWSEAHPDVISELKQIPKSIKLIAPKKPKEAQ